MHKNNNDIILTWQNQACAGHSECLVATMVAYAWWRFHLENMVSSMATYHVLQIVRGGKVLQYARINCNSLENIHGWTVVLYGQSLLHKLFHWKSSRLPINL